MRRQLKAAGLDQAQLPAEFSHFVESVNAAYQRFDSDRLMLERSLELSSQELLTANEDVRAMFEALPDLLLRIDANLNVVTVKAGSGLDTVHPTYQLLNKPLGVVLPEGVATQYQEAFSQIRKDNQSHGFEYSLISSTETNFYEARLQPRPEGQVVAIVRNITRRKIAEAELTKLNAKMAEMQRHAGMAEVATGVLHNVGNVLNSVNVSTLLLRESMDKSQIRNLIKATDLLRDHAADAVAFLTQDPKGRRLPEFIEKVSAQLAVERDNWLRELAGLAKNIEHIKEIVAMQQSYSRVSGVRETLTAAGLVEDALRMNAAGLGRHGIQIFRDYAEVPAVSVDKHKALQILINLIRNAKQAMDEAGKSEKTLTVKIVCSGAGMVQVQVRDNGIGIVAENLARIFQHGFTTKKDGHGFGLHSSANAAREMGGKLSVQSAGLGAGAEFSLELPVVASAAGHTTSAGGLVSADLKS
ncbi:MAG: ATP-binding protein [Verrucomicrobiota bacterium]